MNKDDGHENAGLGANAEKAAARFALTKP